MYPGTRRRDTATEHIAVKVCVDTTRQRSIQQEIDILKELRNHPNIVMLHTTFLDKGQVHMCFERCDEDLEDYVRATPPPMDEEKIGVAGRQISLAVEYLHAQDIMHRDLKPRNILLKASNDPAVKPLDRICKISDFGMARYGMDNGKQEIKSSSSSSMPAAMGVDQTWCGSPLFMSPEMLYRMSYDMSVDIYAIGVILYYMKCKCTPMRGKTVEELRRKLPLCKLIWPLNTSKHLMDVCASAMNQDPSKRPRRLSTHPFFQLCRKEEQQEEDWSEEYVVVENSGNDLSNKTMLQHTLLSMAKVLSEDDRNAIEWAKKGMCGGAVPPDSPSHPQRVKRLLQPERYTACANAAISRGEVKVARVLTALASAAHELCQDTPTLPLTAASSVVESRCLGTRIDSAAPIPILVARFCYNCGSAFKSNSARCSCGHVRYNTSV